MWPASFLYSLQNRSLYCNRVLGLYLSVFVGVCPSEKLLWQYLQQDAEALEQNCIGSEFGIDFQINCFDYDIDEWCASAVNDQMSGDIDTVFADLAEFDLNLLKQDYPNGLDKMYNTAVIIGRLKYEGEIQEVQNEKYGYFRFLGAYPEPLPDKIKDTSDMYKYALDQLAQWGYCISVEYETIDFKEHFIWRAEKDGKTFTALDPLRLLGIVTIVREYGDAWDRAEIPGVFSIKPVKV